MANLGVANKDHKFLIYQQSKYDELLQKIEENRAASIGITDVEHDKHIKLLEKHHLKGDNWGTEPLENVEFDFVGGIVKQYILDIRDRIHLSNAEKPTFVNQIRK